MDTHFPSFRKASIQTKKTESLTYKKEVMTGSYNSIRELQFFLRHPISKRRCSKSFGCNANFVVMLTVGKFEGIFTAVAMKHAFNFATKRKETSLIHKLAST